MQYAASAIQKVSPFLFGLKLLSVDTGRNINPLICFFSVPFTRDSQGCTSNPEVSDIESFRQN